MALMQVSNKRPAGDLQRISALLLVLAATNAAMALDFDDVDVTSKGGVYHVKMEFEVAATSDQVIAVLTDYANPARLDSDVKKREVLSEHDGVTRVRTESLGCVFFFCKEIMITQDVTVVADVIEADIVPEQSNFRSGYLRWSITSNTNGNSNIGFEAVIEPDAFIMPVIGNLLIRKKLRQQVLMTAKNLQTEAVRERNAACLQTAADSRNC